MVCIVYVQKDRVNKNLTQSHKEYKMRNQAIWQQ